MCAGIVSSGSFAVAAGLPGGPGFFGRPAAGLSAGTGGFGTVATGWGATAADGAATFASAAAAEGCPPIFLAASFACRAALAVDTFAGSGAAGLGPASPG